MIGSKIKIETRIWESMKIVSDATTLHRYRDVPSTESKMMVSIKSEPGHRCNHDIVVYKLRWSMRTRWDIVNVRRWDVPEILRMISEPRNSVGSLNEFNVRSWKEKSMEPCRAFFKGPFPLKALERPRHLPNLVTIKVYFIFIYFIFCIAFFWS
jgi:hypothetical protein